MHRASGRGRTMSAPTGAIWQSKAVLYQQHCLFYCAATQKPVPFAGHRLCCSLCFCAQALIVPGYNFSRSFQTVLRSGHPGPSGAASPAGTQSLWRRGIPARWHAWPRWLCWHFAAAQDVLLFLGQHRLNKGKLLVLRVGRYIMRCHTVQPTRLQAGCFHQTLADQQFQHGIPAKAKASGDISWISISGCASNNMACLNKRNRTRIHRS